MSDGWHLYYITLKELIGPDCVHNGGLLPSASRRTTVADPQIPFDERAELSHE